MRVKQRYVFLCVGVYRDSAIRLVAIARRARITDVLEGCSPADRAWNDVLKFKNCDRQVLRSPAVGTAMGEMVGNLAPQIGGDVNAHPFVAPAC